MMQVWGGGMFELGMEESFEHIAFHALPYKGKGGMFLRGRDRLYDNYRGPPQQSIPGRFKKSLPCKCSRENVLDVPSS